MAKTTAFTFTDWNTWTNDAGGSGTLDWSSDSALVGQFSLAYLEAIRQTAVKRFYALQRISGYSSAVTPWSILLEPFPYSTYDIYLSSNPAERSRSLGRAVDWLLFGYNTGFGPWAGTVDHSAGDRKQRNRYERADERSHRKRSASPVHIIGNRLHKNGECVNDHSPEEKHCNEARAYDVVAVKDFRLFVRIHGKAPLGSMCVEYSVMPGKIQSCV